MTVSADYDRATEIVHEIGTMIVTSDRYQDRNWDGIAVTAIVEGGSVQISGYTYENGEKPSAGSPGTGALARKFKELSAAMKKPDGSTWTTALVQVRRDTQKVNIDFEYENPARWQVTPANIETLPEELRP